MWFSENRKTSEAKRKHDWEQECLFFQVGGPTLIVFFGGRGGGGGGWRGLEGDNPSASPSFVRPWL